MRRTIASIGSAVCVLGLALGASAVGGGQGAELQRAEDQVDWSCTNATVHGTYGFFRTGTTAQGPLGSVGVGSYDGVGFFTAAQTTSRNGVYTQGAFGGTYEINADCSGRLLSTDGQSVIAYISVVDKGNEIYMLSASAGNTVTGIAKRFRTREGR